MSKVELPIVEPVFATYHNQGSGAATICDNPSIRNWYLSESVILRCNRKFIRGYTSPEINVMKAFWRENPYLEKHEISNRFGSRYVGRIIKEMLDNGYYVCFKGVDDYYVEGKSWYREKHFDHDGMICGYDDEDKTYTIYAYDKNWIYRKFTTPQKCFHKGRKVLNKKGIYGTICAVKPMTQQVSFNLNTACARLKEYLNSSFEKYPPEIDGWACGNVVHDYIVMYLDKLLDGSIPYERMDRRVFRLIWEHKKLMLERIKKIEEVANLLPETSTSYEKIVSEADNIRMLYASYHMKRRDSLLTVIQKRLVQIKNEEEKLLKSLLGKI